LPAILAFDMPAEDFGAGDGATMARRAILAHEDAVRNHWGRAGIEAVGRGKLLRQAYKVIFAEQVLLSAKSVALLAIASAADARSFAMWISGSEAERRGLFAGRRMAFGARDIKRRMRDDGRCAVV